MDTDGLIVSGTENTQNTWMDVKYDGYAITPRNGKAVEINALWYNALKTMEELSTIFEGKVRHDPYMIAESAIKLICNDLKYEDREDDPEYLMLNAKLKSDKRINKLKKMQSKLEKKSKNLNAEKRVPNRKSKFNDKYSDRIKSIKESDEKFRQTHKMRSDNKEI